MSEQKRTYEGILTDQQECETAYFKILAEKGMTPQLKTLSKILQKMDETRQYAQQTACVREQLEKGNAEEAKRYAAERQTLKPVNSQYAKALDYMVNRALNAMQMAIKEPDNIRRNFYSRMADTHLNEALSLVERL